MKLSETALKLAFFGMKHEAGDIIDYLAINFSILISLLAGVVAAIWIGHAVDVPVGVIAGVLFYGLSMILWSLVLLHHHRG